MRFLYPGWIPLDIPCIFESIVWHVFQRFHKYKMSTSTIFFRHFVWISTKSECNSCYIVVYFNASKSFYNSNSSFESFADFPVLDVVWNLETLSLARNSIPKVKFTFSLYGKMIFVKKAEINVSSVQEGNFPIWAWFKEQSKWTDHHRSQR